MEALYQRLKDRGFTILAVNERENAGEVSGFMRENRLTFPVALDKAGSIGYRYGVQAIPTTYILDKRGFIVSRVVGTLNWNDPKIVAAIEALLQMRN
jgi:peroxiredoxin